MIVTNIYFSKKKSKIHQLVSDKCELYLKASGLRRATPGISQGNVDLEPPLEERERALPCWSGSKWFLF